MLVWFIISFLLAVSYLALMLFYVEEWHDIPEFEAKSISRKTTVSIIIPARNESNNIITCLNAVLNQNYPSNLFEVIVVDDFSEDDTFTKAKSIVSNQVRVYQLEHLLANDKDFASYKKKAIEKAIDQSSADLIITIDADVVMGAKWLRSIVAFYEQTDSLIMAAPVMFHSKNTFLNHFQVLDFCGMMVTTGAVIESNSGSMCNGANLAYKRNAFHYVNGFEGNDKLGSGDDVFLMHKINLAFKGSCRFVKCKAATVYTDAQPSIKNFFSQRQRWASKNKNFKDRKINAQLVLVLAANLAIVYNFCLALVTFILNSGNFKAYCILFCITFIIKCLADFIYLYTGAIYFNKQSSLYWFLPAQVTHILYISTIGVLGNFLNYNWKGRRFER